MSWHPLGVSPRTGRQSGDLPRLGLSSASESAWISLAQNYVILLASPIHDVAQEENWLTSSPPRRAKRRQYLLMQKSHLHVRPLGCLLGQIEERSASETGKLALSASKGACAFAPLFLALTSGSI